MAYPIGKNIIYEYPSFGPVRYPLDDLEVGESVTITLLPENWSRIKRIGNISSSCYDSRMRTLGKKFTCRIQPDGSVTAWRVK